MIERTPKERVAVAFDVETREQALALRKRLGSALGLAKIGSALFVREGAALVRDFRKERVGVFLDLKFHDIPSVVGKAVEKAVAEDVDYVTVHASGGCAMIRAAVDATARSRTKVLAVTVLTSLDLGAWREGASPSEQSVDAAVRRLARLAIDAGARGLVGSAREAALLREAGGPECVVVTPGISVGADAADQARTVSVEEAVASGADILVVGRGVLRATDPAAALRAIQAKLAQVPA
jgi:orotidine-5'-phosphate decarboxylase